VPETEIERDALAILSHLLPRPEEYVDGTELSNGTGLDSERVNNAVGLLLDQGNVEWIRTFGTRPYNFRAVKITPRGVYEAQRQTQALQREGEIHNVTLVDILGALEGIRPPAPIGSPFGFHDEDWESIAQRKSEVDRLYVVLGHQFESEYFDTVALRANINTMFSEALERYHATPSSLPAVLDFRALGAGYGEHLFNEIARDIIGADIAVFETSENNPNVMIEMGVALTWGVRVLPIKLEGRPKPPSDISGQTWADYRDSAKEFVDADHATKLLRMVERAIQKKGRP